MSLPPRWFVGEFLGTLLLVFFGCGSVCAAVLLGAQVGVFQVAIVWGLGVAIAIHLTASLSGAHLNPAVTIALSVFGGFPKRRVPGYVLTQLLAAFVAAALLFSIFADAVRAFEREHQLRRGEAGSEASAMIFGEYFPNPGGKPLDAARARISAPRAFWAEVVGTGILVLVIFGVTDPRNESRPQGHVAFTIGLTVTLLISLLGPLTMACLNPARDLGPRVFSSLAGWGGVPFTTNGSGWFTVYLLAPIVGGLAGGGLHRFVLGPAYRGAPDSTADSVTPPPTSPTDA